MRGQAPRRAGRGAHSIVLSFRMASSGVLRQAFERSPQGGVVQEPQMEVEITVPDNFQGAVISQLNRRRGMIQESGQADGQCTIHALVPLAQMFGYSTDLRSATEGKGEFSMSFASHQQVSREDQDRIIKEYQRERAEAKK